jgi:hypothetical protein
MILFFTAIFIKHFICDFPLQRWSYMYLNKGIYGHLGGLLHAAIHGVATGGIVLFLGFGFINAIYAGIFDFFIHYHTDWTKVSICKKYNLQPNNSEWYWHLLGLDQLIHYLTYIIIGMILWA